MGGLELGGCDLVLQSRYRREFHQLMQTWRTKPRELKFTPLVFHQESGTVWQIATRPLNFSRRLRRALCPTSRCFQQLHQPYSNNIFQQHFPAEDFPSLSSALPSVLFPFPICSLKFQYQRTLRLHVLGCKSWIPSSAILGVAMQEISPCV